MLYLAVLKDSLREAIASRVLLIMLIGIVVVLLLLAPFGLTTEKATEIRRSELTNPERFLRDFTKGQSEAGTPAAHLFSLLNDEQKEKLANLQNPDAEQPRRRGPGASPLKRDLVRQLNELLSHSDFYDADAWSKIDLSEETEELLAQAELDAPALKRRNLLLLIDAFPRPFRIVDSNAISITYGTGVVQGPVQITPTQFESFFDIGLQFVVAMFLGFLGVFLCLLVTAGIIPRTFEPGEISLLLSKPVRRSVLFVTKFFGGCFFTLVYATVLVVGIFFLLWWRMGFWRPELLWCIPVYVFLFAIYYSISAVAGAIWRNSIVALALVVVFWLGVTTIGTMEAALKQNLLQNRGIREVTIAGNDLLTVDGEKNVYAWNDGEQNWQRVFREAPGGMDRFARLFLASGVRFVPVYDSANDRILALQQTMSRFGGLGSSELITGSADDDWERVSLGRVPEFTPMILISGSGRILLPARGAIYQFNEQERPPAAGLLSNLTGGLFGNSGRDFVKVNPDDMPDLGDDFGAAINLSDDSLMVYGNGKLHRLTAGEEKFDMASTRDFETEDTAVLATGGKHTVIGFADGKIIAVDNGTLETVAEMTLDDGVLPRVCLSSPDGQSIATLTHEQTVFLFDAETETFHEWTVAETSTISAVTFTSENQLVAADGRLGVRQYLSTKAEESEEEWTEPTTLGYHIYDYAVKPAWTILPKPAQLDQFVSYVLSGEKTILTREGGGSGVFVNRNSLEQQRETFQPKQVIFDNAIFVVVMLAFGCLYISRSDF